MKEENERGPDWGERRRAGTRVSCSLQLHTNPSRVPVFCSVLVPDKGCSGTGNSAFGEGISNSRMGGVGNSLYLQSLYTY